MFKNSESKDSAKEWEKQGGIRHIWAFIVPFYE